MKNVSEDGRKSTLLNGIIPTLNMQQAGREEWYIFKPEYYKKEEKRTFLGHSAEGCWKWIQLSVKTH